VLAPSNDRSPELARYLRRLTTPIVLLDREVRGLRCDAVLVDHGPALLAAVRYLVGHGRRSIGLITRDDRTRPARELVAGFRAACRAADLPGSSIHVAQFVDLDQQAAHVGVDQLLERGVDSIIATGTLTLTAGILERLTQRGVSVPGHVAVVTWGHAGPEPAETSLPTIVYPVEEVARLTARLIISRVQHSAAPPRVELAQTRFVAGGLSAQAATREVASADDDPDGVAAAAAGTPVRD
jgi:LacI family transcriptional regulator